MARKRAKKKDGNGATLGFEQTLWQPAHHPPVMGHRTATSTRTLASPMTSTSLNGRIHGLPTPVVVSIILM
jgi:hypothetical protein